MTDERRKDLEVKIARMKEELCARKAVIRHLELNMANVTHWLDFNRDWETKITDTLVLLNSRMESEDTAT